MLKLPSVSMGSFRVDRIDLCCEYDSDGWHVELRCMLHGAGLVGGKQQVYAVQRIPLAELQFIDRAELVLARHVRALVLDTIVHEVDEWLRLNEKLVSNPHPEHGTTDCWLKGP